MPSVQWAEPALLWGNRRLNDLNEPRLMELKSDNFMTDFLAAMERDPVRQSGAAPLVPARDFIEAHDMGHGNTQAWKLYQPLHSCYYLVTASLVCRQVGLPDKSVAKQDGERTTFVVRMLRGQQEYAWTEGRGWQPIEDGGYAVHQEEEHFPLHPVTVCTGETDADICERDIYYGYIAAGNRNKYTKPIREADSPSPPPAERLKQFYADVDEGGDYRQNEFDTRVIAQWQMLLEEGRGSGAIAEIHKVRESSLYLVLDFADFLARALPNVWNAVRANSNSGLTSAEETLYDTLNDVTIGTNTTVSGRITLAAAMRDLQDRLDLVRGEGEEPAGDTYNAADAEVSGISISTAFVDGLGGGGTLATRVQAALDDETRPMAFGSEEEAEEMMRLLDTQVRPQPDEKTAEDVYVVRMVYQYDPDPTCPRIVSDPSHRFTLAGYMDPDAPARMVQIEMPSMKMKDLRKFKRGVGIQMSPDMRDLMNRVNKGMLDGAGLAGDAGGWTLGMICTFSIQIIMMVALIVMFIFLISLNFVFWWLPILKICFPIPKRTN